MSVMPLGSCFAWLRPKKMQPPGEATLRLTYLRYQLEEEVSIQEVRESLKLSGLDSSRCTSIVSLAGFREFLVL